MWSLRILDWRRDIWSLHIQNWRLDFWSFKLHFWRPNTLILTIHDRRLNIWSKKITIGDILSWLENSNIAYFMSGLLKTTIGDLIFLIY